MGPRTLLTLVVIASLATLPVGRLSAQTTTATTGACSAIFCSLYRERSIVRARQRDEMTANFIASEKKRKAAEAERDKAKAFALTRPVKLIDSDRTFERMLWVAALLVAAGGAAAITYEVTK